MNFRIESAGEAILLNCAQLTSTVHNFDARNRARSLRKTSMHSQS